MYRNKSLACVVLNYNDSDQTSEFVKKISSIDCLDAIIVVDNNSTDDSYSKLLSYDGGKIKVVKTQKNGGYGYGNNFGAKIAKFQVGADYTVISNPDVQFDEKLVISIIDAFIGDKSLAVVSSIQKNGYTGQELENCGWRIPTYWDYLSSSLIMINKLTSKQRYININKNEKIQYVECVPGAFLVVDSDKFFQAGGYDESIFLFCEESILGYRIHEIGYNTAILTNMYYNHFHSTSIKKSIPQELARHKLVLKSRKKYIEKYLNVSWIKRILASIVFFCSVIEYKFLYMIKK